MSHTNSQRRRGPITAGGQAEYLFEKGLTEDKRALIEFPGVGHAMNIK